MQLDIAVNNVGSMQIYLVYIYAPKFAYVCTAGSHGFAYIRRGSNVLKHRFVVCVNKQVNNCASRDTKELAQRCITTPSFGNTIHRYVYSLFTS